MKATIRAASIGAFAGLAAAGIGTGGDIYKLHLDRAATQQVQAQEAKERREQRAYERGVRRCEWAKDVMASPNASPSNVERANIVASDCLDDGHV